MWQTCLKCHLDLNLINFSAGAAELKWKKILLNTKYYNSYTKSKEAVSYDRINMTKNWLEYDPKFLTMRNLNGLTWPKLWQLRTLPIEHDYRKDTELLPSIQVIQQVI